jgi:hypothetical protein
MPAAEQTTTFSNYLRFVQNATAKVPHEFIKGLLPRIERAYDTGETVEMVAEEITLRFSLRRPLATKTPRALAARVVRVEA